MVFAVLARPSSIESTAGALGQTVKAVVCTFGQLALERVIGPPAAPAGTVAVMVVLLTTVKLALTLLVNVTPVTLPPVMKFVPVMVTVFPTFPAVGAIPLPAGQLSAGVTVELPSEISKKMFPTASTLMRAEELERPLGIVTPADPLLGTLAASTVGKLIPPSVDREIFTLAAFTGAPFVPLTFQVTVWFPLNVPPPFGDVTVKGPELPSTVMATALSFTPNR